MKRLLFFMIPACMLACNDNASHTTEIKRDSTTTITTTTTEPANNVVADYPYTIEHPDYWEMNGNKNTVTALKALKAWEDRKMDEAASYFSDSVKLEFDGPEMVVKRDSLKNMFFMDTLLNKGVRIKMNDWESVISKDKQEEWVTIWYRQFAQDRKGQWDSISVINDMQFDGSGKIKRLAEYRRKFH